jgi:hypothetical protein
LSLKLFLAVKEIDGKSSQEAFKVIIKVKELERKSS